MEITVIYYIYSHGSSHGGSFIQVALFSIIIHENLHLLKSTYWKLVSSSRCHGSNKLLLYLPCASMEVGG